MIEVVLDLQLFEIIDTLINFSVSLSGKLFILYLFYIFGNSTYFCFPCSLPVCIFCTINFFFWCFSYDIIQSIHFFIEHHHQFHISKWMRLDTWFLFVLSFTFWVTHYFNHYFLYNCRNFIPSWFWLLSVFTHIRSSLLSPVDYIFVQLNLL